jgi:hypothetical protein
LEQFLFISPLSIYRHLPFYCLFSEVLEFFKETSQNTGILAYPSTGAFTVNLPNMTGHYLHSYNIFLQNAVHNKVFFRKCL